MIEVFKDVPNYEGIYQVSNFGNVKSLSRIIINRGAKYSCEEKLMKPLKTKTYKEFKVVQQAKFLTKKPIDVNKDELIKKLAFRELNLRLKIYKLTKNKK